MGGSTEGPIYSTIDATSEDLHSFTYAQHAATPYASTSIMPFTSQTQASAHGGEQQGDGHWIAQPGPSGAQYAQPDRCNGGESSSQGQQRHEFGKPVSFLVPKRRFLE